MRRLARLSTYSKLTGVFEANKISPSYVDVAILGGGFSGLAAAKEIVSANKSVMVIEATSRVGGRVQDGRWSDGAVAQLGAQFVGPSQNSVLRLGKELGVDFIKTYTNGSSLVRFNRKVLSSDDLSASSFPLAQDVLQELAATVTNLDSMASSIDLDKPWSHPKAKEWDSVSVSTWLQNNVNSIEVRKIIALLAGHAATEEPESLSFLSIITAVKASGNATNPGSIAQNVDISGGAQDSLCKGGCQQIALKLADLLGPEMIMLNSAVNLVETTEHGYTIFTNGGTVCSKKVILTMSPTMSGRILFSPPMPASRDQLTQRVPMGLVTKVQVRYSSPWWRKNGFSGLSISDTGLLSSTVDNSPQNGSFGVLLGFIVAEATQGLSEMSDAEMKSAIVEDLVELYGPKARNTTEVIVYQWGNEEYVRGGYASYFPPTVYSRYGEHLAKPVGGIHFAGVATSKYWRGHMDGAISAGERAAKEVLQAL